MSTLRDSLEFIAYNNGLELIETTSERNGYPSHLKYAIIGFDSFEKAEKIANENGLQIEIFEKRDGWQLYFRTGNTAYEEFDNSAYDFGDSYNAFDKSNLEDYFENEVKSMLQEFDNMENLQKFIDKQKEIIEKLEDAEDNEVIITCYGQYYDTIKKRSMSFYHDTRTVVIGVIGVE